MRIAAAASPEISLDAYL